jgi:hypothetical protein
MSIEAVRVTPAGDVLDTTPILLAVNDPASYTEFADLSAAFNGEGTSVFWAEDFDGPSYGPIYSQRLSQQGVVVDASPTLVSLYETG